MFVPRMNRCRLSFIAVGASLTRYNFIFRRIGKYSRATSTRKSHVVRQGTRQDMIDTHSAKHEILDALCRVDLSHLS
jgi:hypothetical protein